MDTLKNKIVLVTGASGGIGKETAIQLALHGAKVVVNYSANAGGANQAVEQIRTGGGEALAIQADVSSKEQVTALFDRSLSAFGKIDVLVNNAGIMHNRLLKDNSPEDFDNHFNINVRGVINTMQEAFGKLADGGSIINVSSSTTRMMLPAYGIYSASKAAVEQLTRVFSKEIGRGINVNAIAPGPTETELFTQGKSEEMIRRMASMNAFNRLANPADIARVIAFLAADDAKWISGQVICANGAMV